MSFKFFTIERKIKCQVPSVVLMSLDHQKVDMSLEITCDYG